jgi:hypothetical protein
MITAEQRVIIEALTHFSGRDFGSLPVNNEQSAALIICSRVDSFPNGFNEDELKVLLLSLASYVSYIWRTYSESSPDIYEETKKICSALKKTVNKSLYKKQLDKREVK